MSAAEDILYRAHHEGIKDLVFEESKRLRTEDPKKWKYVEYTVVLEEAYNNIKEKLKKRNENI
tara:strand:+ start:843 stop:1031 length:189 start_codon:yes stop_codon:yes gene_type:complete